MSLNKTLDRLFAEIRREAKRNPDFADRLDAVLRLHGSKREVDAAVLAEAAAPARPKPLAAVQAEPFLNPVAVLKHEGEAALAAALARKEAGALRALVAEHNLDPSGETAGLDRASLAAHVIAQAKRRAERDEKLFEY
jgi:hypothetical protein